MTDMVNHPPHYNAGKYEVIDIIESITNSMELTPFEGYCGRALFIWRALIGGEEMSKDCRGGSKDIIRRILRPDRGLVR